MTLEDLNSLTSVTADEEFLKCCGSMRWAKRMSDARPFSNSDDLSAKADEIWWSLSEEDWLEAFRAHPKIGEKKAAAAQSAEAEAWSAQEQSETERAADETKAALAEGNRAYERRFGFIFIQRCKYLIRGSSGGADNEDEAKAPFIRAVSFRQRRFRFVCGALSFRLLLR